MAHRITDDERIPHLVAAAERFGNGDFTAEDIPEAPLDMVGTLGRALRELAQHLDARFREHDRIDQITTEINNGLLLDEILGNVYEAFKGSIPYDRIGFSLIDEATNTVYARWARTELDKVKLTAGYRASLAGSSLQGIIASGRPRIINDLEEYLHLNPESESTRLIVDEGLRSSLTCPLIVDGLPVGFMFFSSVDKYAYQDVHVATFERISAQLSVIVDKGRIASDLALRKEEIERQNQELTRINELKNRLLGAVAHDLRNPIAAVQMTAELLADGNGQLSAAERETFLADIRDQAGYMAQLIDDLLDTAQLESGRLDLDVQPVDLGDLLRTTVARHAALAGPKRTHVDLEICPEAVVPGDPVRLRQALDNLISNAVKFSPPGSRVVVGCVAAPGTYTIRVSDDGPGIPETEHDRLFRFYERTANRPTGGESSTGLGLAITRRIVEGHGGNIGVDSAPGRGSTFWFTLPAG
jgi:signal transduction histidine kinase